MGRFYLTTPIYYVNDAPHVGTRTRTVNADALARWHRLIGDEIWFLTGTDEHGAKIAEAAEANGMTPAGVDGPDLGALQGGLAALDISNDDFIRTTEPRHYETVQAVPPADLRQRLHRARTPTRASTAWPARTTTPRTSSSTATARSTGAR